MKATGKLICNMVEASKRTSKLELLAKVNGKMGNFLDGSKN
jgi:hypothetical protein